mgnify:CR=1 FL=1
MPLETLSLLAQGDSENGVSPIMWVALAAVVLLVIFIARSFKSRGASGGASNGSVHQNGTPPAAPAPHKPAPHKPVMTAEDVVAIRFMPIKLTPGYSQPQVDELLGRITSELRRLQDDNERLQLIAAKRLNGPAALTDPIITPEQVVTQKFTPTKFREGYSQDQVDDFLDKVVVGLRQWTSENEQLRARISGNVRS